MRQFLAAFAVSSLIILLVHGFGRNGIDPDAPQAASTMEMVVFEHPDCTTCPAFRTKVAPRYEAMPQAADAPLRSTGEFWHDRRTRPTHRVPWTKESEEDRRRLWDTCVQLSEVA